MLDDEFKQYKLRLTLMQETILATMWLWEDRQRIFKRDPEHVSIFETSFFREMLGTNWQTYHHKLMDELVELGWIRVANVRGRSKRYMLTGLARLKFAEYEARAKIYQYSIKEDGSLW